MPLDSARIDMSIIESHVPLPATTKRGPYSKVGKVLSQMAVGQSVLISRIPAHYGAVQAYMHRAKGVKYVLRKTSEGYRCWRKA